MMTEMVLVQKAVSKVFGDFVSKVVSDGVDVLKGAIRNADLDRKSYNHNLQTRLYQLMIDALNRFTHNKYEKQDKLYDAAESILKGYISTKDNMDAIESGLKMLVSDVNNDICQEFIETLCGEICRDKNSDLYKEIDMLWKRQESEYIHSEFEKSNQNGNEILKQLDNLKEVVNYLRGNMNSQRENKEEHYKTPIKNRADEYAQKWDKNVFLNDFNKRDRNTGVNIKLKDLYLEEHLPHYVWKMDDEPLNDLKELLSEYTVDNDDKRMLLILGQAGIGKSTLITWMMANLVVRKEDILVYQIASDLDNVDWQSKNILNDIFSVIGLEYEGLENKTLILDGFDEIHTDSDRERILNKLNQELKRWNTLESFSLIITCRENYIYSLQDIKCDYIILQAWDETQIESFCRAYWGKCKKAILESKIQKIQENKEIFGIPLILYMILALDIAIEKSSSIVDIYDQIFSLEKGAIYDRCYDSEHRINLPKIKEHIYLISQKMAFWIYENNADKAFISQEKFEEICNNEMSEYGEKGEYIQNDTLIGNFFKIKHSEGKGTDELQFVHRSIYEYFVAVFFYESIHKLPSKEKVAGKLGELLKDGRLSPQILKFVKYKFDGIKGIILPDIIKEIFQIMLRDGMIYHTGVPYTNIIEREINIFSSMLEVVHLWNYQLEITNSRINVYLQRNYLFPLNLFGAILEGIDLRRVNLMGANLFGAKLTRANLFKADLCLATLKGANLSGANLEGADLGSANLEGADLSVANLKAANLKGADLRAANLSGANLAGVDLSQVSLYDTNLRRTVFDEKQVDKLCGKYNIDDSMIYIFEMNGIISYKEYCMKKQ